jgi:uncharacterized membrane protein
MLRDVLGTRAGRAAAAATVVLAVATAVAVGLLWPTGESDAKLAPALSQRTELAQVVAVDDVECSGPGLQNCRRVRVALKSGPDEGRSFDLAEGGGPAPLPLSAGDRLRVARNEQPEGAPRVQPYAIADFDRRAPMLWLLVAFVVIVAVLGRRRGVMALLGLGVSLAVVILFVVPAILDGRSPVLVAIVGAAAIMLTVLYLTHGFSLTTTIAVAGTLASLTVTAALSAIATALTHLSGVADETSSYLNITQSDVNMHGLLLAGIVIGSLGVLDDVTVTQSATVSELARANPAAGFRELYTAATRVGRAHIASVINTLVLAYAGTSLPLMLLFAVGNTPIGELLTGQLIAQELVRTAVGTIGLITAVPITTALAALLAARQAQLATPDLPRQPAPALATASPPASERPQTDPWMAFVERHPDNDH